MSNVIHLPKSATHLALEKLRDGLDKGMTAKAVEVHEWRVSQEQFAIEAHIRRLSELTSKPKAIQYVIDHVNKLMEETK